MKKESIENWRTWSALYCIESNIDLRNIMIKDNYLELSKFIQNLIDFDFVEYSQGSYLLTRRGKYKKKKLEEELDLNGMDKFVVPNFNVLFASSSENDLYYF